MLMRALFNTNNSRWEQSLVASAYLSNKSIPKKAFDQAVLFRLQQLTKELQLLPRVWAEQVCLEILDDI